MIGFLLLTSLLQLSHIAHSISIFSYSILLIHNSAAILLVIMTQSATKLRQQSLSCNTASRGFIQTDPTQATEPSRPALPATPDAIPGSSIPLQMDQPSSIPEVNTIDALDSREDKPSTWNEVYLLQEALKPSIRSFTRVTARAPPVVPESHWLSYADQLEILQRESDKHWTLDQRAGAPPKLAKLASWRGGIIMVDGAEFRITEEMTEQFTHQKFRRDVLPDQHGTLGWYQQTFNEQAHNELGCHLSAANARRESFRAQVAEGQDQHDASENIATTLDSIVARDPERYLAWLSTMGYFHFTTDRHNPYGYSWEEWCTWIAPRSFQIYCKPDVVVMWPPFGLGAVNAAKYGQLGDRPTISLEEAKRGNRRALEFLDGADGLEVSTKEKAQYYMIGGEATSREAAAHYHAIRGEDVWLFEPTNSFIEAGNDPSRQREAEVEASFECL